MTFSRKKIILMLTGIFCFFVFLLLLNYVQAATSTIKGKAYWGEYGYLYFHCSDDVIGNRLDQSENLSGGNIYINPPAEEAFHFYSEPCTDLIHGVYISEEGALSGEAWNPNFGLITFEHNDIDPPDGFGSFNSVCEDVCNPFTNCIACYVPEDQTIYGWGRIVSADDNKWIRLDAYPPDNLSKIYTNDNDPIYPDASLELGDFAGTASSSIWGDISFNCETENYSDDGTCATRDYKVYIKNLIFGRLSAPNWTYSNACSSADALRAVLRWDKLSGIQTGYEIVVNDSNNLSTSTGEYVCWSGEKTGEAQQYTVPNIIDCPNALDYNTAYYWWLRGFDEDGEPTDWIQYDTNSISNIDGDKDDDPLTFQTFLHEFPNPFFSWEPLEIITSTSTTFTSESFAYSSAEPDTPVECSTNPSLCPGYLWETSDEDAEISDPTEPITDIIFYHATNTSVTLKVTDIDGYYCSTSTIFKINYDLPLWREIKAE